MVNYSPNSQGMWSTMDETSFRGTKETSFLFRVALGNVSLTKDVCLCRYDM